MLMQEEKVRNVNKSIKENVNVNILSLWKPEWMVLLRIVKLYQWLDSEEEDGYPYLWDVCLGLGLPMYVPAGIWCWLLTFEYSQNLSDLTNNW